MSKSRFRAGTAGVVLAGVLVASLALFVSRDGGKSNAEPAQKAVPHEEKAPAPSTSARALADDLSALFEQASNHIAPSVVPIYADQTVDVSSEMPNDQFRQFFGDEFFHRFFQQGPQGDQGGKQTFHSVGSGVIVTSDGYILTNNHVVSHADKLTVILEGGKRYEAKVVGTDPPTDVAVIKIDAKDLPAAKLGDSDQLRVGQWVIAVGNPFQLLHSVTAGIVSARGRSSIGLAEYEDFIQTDASINPGNSGGALADLDGNVIGINTAISSPSGANAGVGFAIPINMAKQVMDQLMDRGEVKRGYLALLPQDINDDLAKALKLDDREGALVGGVTPEGPADQAGIKRGDVIVSFDGKKVADSTELRKVVANASPGSKATLTVLRDGKSRDFDVKLGERPVQTAERSEEGDRGGSKSDRLNEDFGLAVQDLTADAAHRLGYEHAKGALVAGVRSGSPAEEAGLRRGDLIVEVDREPVSSAGDVSRDLRDAHSGDTVALLVQRGDNTFFSALSVP